MADVAHEFSFEVCNRGEYAAGDDIAFDLAEPQLDLVEPRGVRRGEVQMDVGVSGQELINALGLVRREIVGDDVDLFATRLVHDQIGRGRRRTQPRCVAALSYPTLHRF